MLSKRLLLIAIPIMLTAACDAAVTSTSTPSLATLPTLTLTSTRTPPPTPQPTDTPTRLPTVPPSATEETGPVRIEFEPGAARWSTQIESGLGGIKQFVLHAFGGQTMRLIARPLLPLSIVGEDGVELIGKRTYNFFWRGQLPSTQDYLIEVGLGEGRAGDGYTLSVAINPPGQTSQTFDYIDEQHGFALTYSDYFAAVDRPTTISPSLKGDLSLSLMLIGNEYYEGTNLSLSYIYVATSQEPQILSVCTHLPIGFPMEQDGGEVEVNSVVYQRSSLAEGGVSNIWQQTIYRTLHANRCHEIILMTHSHAIDAYEPGTVTEFDAAALAAKMDFVFESFTLLDD